MKWFKHDSNAHIDAKIKRVKHKYGITGYGLYWYCIELIAGALDSKNITFELEEDAEIIALEWSLDQLKVQEIMMYMVEIGLFENSNGRISCLKLAKRLDDTNSKNPEIRRILAVLDKAKLGDTPTNSESVLPDKTRLDETRVDKSKDIKPPVAFAPVDSGIFEYWKAVMGKDNSVKPTAGRMSKIKARLKDGYTEEQIKSAIDGCKSSDHHMGKNDSGKVYDCLTLICRSAEKLDMFIGYTKVFNPEVKRDQDLDAWANGSNISQAQGEIYEHE